MRFIALIAAASAAVIHRAPSSQNLFATGMNGDEDLGQDIIMKGEKFHYDQKRLAQVQACQEAAAKGEPWFPFTQQIAGPDRCDQIGKTVFDASHEGMDAQPMDRPYNKWDDGPPKGNHRYWEGQKSAPNHGSLS